jgi:PAS domain S-box-containing protein
MQPDALLAAIVASSDDAIVTKGLDGVITTWNAGAERLFGYAAAEAVGRHITLIIPKDHLAEETFVMQSVIAGTGMSHFETVRVRKDGGLIDISLAVSPVRDSTGTIIGASKIARDITAQKRLAAHLDEEIRIVETLNRIGVMVTGTLDRDRVVSAVLDASVDVTLATAGVFMCPEPGGGERICSSTRGSTGDAFLPRRPSPAATDESRLDISKVIRVPDIAADRQSWGTFIFGPSMETGLPVRSYLSIPVVARSGALLGRVCMGHSDPNVFTERHERLAIGIAGWGALALENAQLYQEAQRANQLKDDFLATLSHELRTPLNAIMGWAQILGSTVVDERARVRATETIQRNARVQARLVDDLLDVSRIVSGKLVLRREEVELTSVIAAAIEDIRPSAAEREIELRSFIHDGGVVIGDPARLQQIVWNLLSNAVKFTPRGGVVTVTLTRAERTAQLTVADTGQGIDPEFLAHVFDRFRQADPSSTRRHGGLGLGLGIVQHLTQAHGGVVHAISEGIGHGATFVVQLPVRDSDYVPAGPGRRESSSDATSRLAGVRVLAVDDERDAADVLAMALRSAGAEVVTANSARDALVEVGLDGFDVVLADIGMPDMDGYALMRALRADPARKAFLAIAVTAYASPAERASAIEAGFDLHLSKPLPPEDVVAAVARALER